MRVRQLQSLPQKPGGAFQCLESQFFCRVSVLGLCAEDGGLIHKQRRELLEVFYEHQVLDKRIHLREQNVPAVR